VTGQDVARRPFPLVRAAHPVPSLAVTVLVVVLAVGAGMSGGRIVVLALAVLTGQLSVGWANDVLDVERDRQAERRDKPVARGEIRASVVATAAGVAVLLCVPLSLALGLRPGLAHLVAVGAAWAYDLGLKSTVWSPLPYAVAFGLAPAVVWWAVPATPPWWLVVAGALLGIGAHGTNVLPDLRNDELTGVRGLPQRLGARRTRILTAASLGLSVLVLAVAPPGPVGPAGWVSLAAAALLIAAGLVRAQLAFPTTVAVAGVAVLLLAVRGGGVG
jgi:4-hydroxybenzoate polyprenyltransferase